MPLVRSQNSKFAIQLYSGRFIDLSNPKPDDISIIDIAVALTRLCRFVGHCERQYSVANHSLLVMQLQKCPSLRLPALLHDAHEAYVGDQSTPLKLFLQSNSQYDCLEEIKNSLDCCIAHHFGFSFESFYLPSIKEADQIALATEARGNMKPAQWINNLSYPLTRQLEILDDKATYAAFISAFNALTGRNVSLIYPPVELV